MAAAGHSEQPYPFTPWNFVVITIDAAFFCAGLAFIDPVVILPVLIEKLHGSQVTIGLMGAIQRAGWIVPQLIGTSFVLHRRRKKPFVILPVLVSRAPFIPLAISFYVAPPGSKVQVLLAFLIGVYAIFFFADGLVGVPWHDIIARTIPPNLRGRFFASINIGSGIFAIGAGAVVRRVLSDPSLPFPHNYGLLFMFLCGCMAMSTLALVFIKEPHGSPISERQSLLRIIRSVPSTLRRYPALSRLIIAQNLMGASALAIPFYAVYANTRLGLPESVSGLFIWAGIAGMLIASLVWAYCNDRFGPRLVLRGVSLLAVAAPVAAAGIPPVVRALHLQGEMAFWYAAAFLLNSAAAAGAWMGVTNYVLELAPDDIRPLFLGLSATLSAPVMLMPLIGGVLLSVISYQALFAIAALSAVGATVYVFRLEQPGRLASHPAYEPATSRVHALTYAPEAPRPIDNRIQQPLSWATMPQARTRDRALIPANGTTLYRFSRRLLRALFRIYNRWEVTGREHVPETGGVLLIANHTSYADPPIVGAACPRPVNFMAKSELFRIPLLSAFISRAHAFPVKRGAADQHALRRALRLLNSGRALLIFPEGTRSPDGRRMPFEAGAAFVALAANAQVVPVGIDGADRLLPHGTPILLPAKLRVRFGPPIDLSRFREQRRNREVLQQACDAMSAALSAVLPPERQPL